MRKITVLVAALALLAMSAVPALALEVGDLISKGEVQSYFGWNNNQLQAAAANKTLVAEATAEWTWTCSKPHPGGGDQDRDDIVQQRASVTTSYALAAARVRNQITGWNVIEANTNVSGPTLGSCPAEPSGFAFDDNLEAGESSGASYAFLP